MGTAFGADPGAPSLAKTTTAAYAARAASALPQPVEQVALHVRRALEDGVDRFTVELKPASLGRISAEIEVGDHRRVTVVLSAERQETLDLLQRDARVLERALQDAGLKTDSGSLAFRFQDGNSQPGDAQSRDRATIAVPADLASDDEPLRPAASPVIALRPGGIDIRV
jgi:hypothetical protein